MISIEQALRHTAWADDLLFTKLAELPAAALACTYGPPDWTVGAIATHIVSGAEWCRYVLTGSSWTDLRPAADRESIEALKLHLRDVYADIFVESSKDDEPLSYADEYGDKTALRSTVLSQVAYHSVEHRTQIAVALEVNGFAGIVLDDFDLWVFESTTRP